jgi:hypothetical protein
MPAEAMGIRTGTTGSRTEGISEAGITVGMVVMVVGMVVAVMVAAAAVVEMEVVVVGARDREGEEGEERRGGSLGIPLFLLF